MPAARVAAKHAGTPTGTKKLVPKKARAAKPAAAKPAAKPAAVTAEEAPKVARGVQQRGKGVFSGCRELRCVHSGTAPKVADPASASTLGPGQNFAPWQHACVFSDMNYFCAICSRPGLAQQMSAVHLGAGALLVCAARCGS